MIDVQKIIKKLGLESLPIEGGYYKETYRDKDFISKDCLSGRYNSDKCFSSAIFYLLTPDTFSALHRLPAEEVFHFYLGDPAKMLQLHPDGSSEVITLGQDIENNHKLQAVVPRGAWQGSFLEKGGIFALMGTTMSPGFDFSDYEAGVREDLLKKYPEQRELIIRLTR